MCSQAIDSAPPLAPSTDPPAGTAAPVTPTARPISRARVWSFASAAGVAAGLASWFAGEMTVGYHAPVTEAQTVMGNVFRIPVKGAETVAGTRNATLAFGILGVIMGLAMGLAGGSRVGLPRRGSRPRSSGP